MIKLKWVNQAISSQSQIRICQTKEAIKDLNFEKPAMDYVSEQWEKEKLIVVEEFFRTSFVINLSQEVNREELRTVGAKILTKLEEANRKEVFLNGGSMGDKTAVLEGLISAAYQFFTHKPTASDKKLKLKEVILLEAKEEKEVIEETVNIWKEVWQSRDWVNTPHNFQTAVSYAEELKQRAKDVGVNATVFDFKKIKELKMGGLLAVNQGSFDPPSFSILEWKPDTVKNKKPVVLVGKGIVYDTGGLSLKPTDHSMDYMKTDMAGSAAVAGAIFSIARNKLPVHVIAIIPATDNRPGNKAIAPGDVITMHNGKTVEVMNTDAEGRLVLADGLSYAKEFSPELIFTVATLTGSAARAIGTYGAVTMGNAEKKTFKTLKTAGEYIGERVVEFPFWDDYKDELKSPIADLKNLGSNLAGAITAGKFLEHFTTFPYIHIDIAGPAYLHKAYKHLPFGATGFGVSLLYQFIKKQYC